MFTVKFQGSKKVFKKKLFKNISCLRLSTIYIIPLKFFIRFKNISCLRLSAYLVLVNMGGTTFKNISCLRLSFKAQKKFLKKSYLKTFHVYG